MHLILEGDNQNRLWVRYCFFPIINRTITASMTIPPNPKINSPILAALGTPSSTAPPAQAILKYIEKIPMLRLRQESQCRRCFLAYSYRKYPVPTVRKPKIYQVNAIIIFPDYLHYILSMPLTTPPRRNILVPEHGDNFGIDDHRAAWFDSCIRAAGAG